MTEKTYKEIIDETMAMCTDVLFKKKGEYATAQDYFHNFNVAAELEGITPKQALAGMMAKHTVSVYDMCNSAEDFPNGSQVYIEGLGWFVAEDTGGGLKGKHIDVFMASHERALKAGVRSAVVWVRKNG